MKRLLFLTLAILSASCSGPRESIPRTHSLTMERYEFEGHDYILFQRYGGVATTSYSIAVVHAPDCPCRSKQSALTEWQMLQLAIAYTESKFDPSAVGSSEDLGLLQIRPIYAREASRLSPNREYAHSEALDPSKSLEMFNVVQGHHNPEHDTAKAIALHNKADWYKRRVLDNLDLIRRMEATRAIVLKYE